jgi:quinone-modifying oxidoreductase subunit QmoC
MNMAAESAKTVTIVDPDLDFIKKLKEAGGDTLKKCMQCANCSVACPLAPDSKPFPRKEMIWAGWGLRDKLAANPDVWMCHQCNDCSLYCPRGAKPGDVLAAIRSMAIRDNAFPNFLGNIVAEKKYLPLLFIVPAVLFFLILSATGHLKIPAGDVVFSKLLPIMYVDSVFVPTSLLMAFFAYKGIMNFWKALVEADARQGTKRYLTPPLPQFVKMYILPVLSDILTHVRFKKCGPNRDRYTAHLGIFYGFVGLFIVTNVVMVGHYIFHMDTPFSMIGPVKLLANFSAIILFIGMTLVIRNRMAGADDPGASGSSYSDWSLIWVIYGVTITGILSETLRLAGIAAIAYPMYFAHLLCVFCLFVYLPYSKLAHLLYRTTAMVYAKYTGRD